MGSIAIMQPYLFPYIGYFQLIKEVDLFVFYDDVDFITRGWINRNKININGCAKYFTIPCKNASQNKLISQIEHALSEKEKRKLLRKIELSYKKAPFFEEIFKLYTQVLNTKSIFISDMAISSIEKSTEYLGLNTRFIKSSEKYNNKSCAAADRLIDICNKEKVNNYVNAIGGRELYSKEYFAQNGIELRFLLPEKISYKQFDQGFVPWLSILDVMMFNSPEQVKNNLLSSYRLI